MSQINELVATAKKELLDQAKENRVEEIKDRIKEIAAARITLNALEESLMKRLGEIEQEIKEDARLLDTSGFIF